MHFPELPLVGMIGRKRTGKDTVAGVLATEFGFEKAAFADPLREVVEAIDPIVDYRTSYKTGPGVIVPVRYSEAVRVRTYEGAKDAYPEVRQVLQRLGTDGIRKLDSDFWVRIALGRIDARTTPLVLTDVRFPNEAETIVDRGGWIVRVLRDGTKTDGEHVSESALDDYPEDFTISNNGTLEELRGVVRTVAQAIV